MSTVEWRGWLGRHFSDRCALCDSGTRGLALCSYCAEALPAVRAPCPVCALEAEDECPHPPGWQLDGLYAPMVYAAAAKILVHRLKFDGQRWLGEVMGHIIADQAGEIAPFDLCFTVPLHRRRLAQRGFNQALAIAHGALPGTRIATGLVRTVDTPPQAQLSARNRELNLAYCFELRRSVDHCRVLIVDDVVTTGTTLNVLADLLRQRGAKSIHGLAFARTLAPQTVSV